MGRQRTDTCKRRTRPKVHADKWIRDAIREVGRTRYNDNDRCVVCGKKDCWNKSCELVLFRKLFGADKKAGGNT